MKKIYFLLSFFFLSFMIHAQNPDAFIITVEVGNNSTLGITGLDFTVPIWNNPTQNNYTVDFGDGTVLTNQKGNATHTYSASGVYTITLTGVYKRIYFGGLAINRRKLKTIEQWGTNQWETMIDAFKGCENLIINATDTPDLSQVTNMSNMFYNCQSLNQSLNNWDVSNVTSMGYLFQYASSFNQPLDNWDTSNVVDMRYMFDEATSFNQNINNWDTSSVMYMQNMFNNATSFNQPLDNWNVSNVVNMSAMFSGASSFNQPLNNWDVSLPGYQKFSRMFSDASSFNQPLDNWDVSIISNFSYMFSYATAFNQSINNWDVSNATTMEGMFEGATLFNQPLDNWDVSNVTNMKKMFKSATSFNQDISNWDVSNVDNMEVMFYGATSFDKPLDIWDVSGVYSMEGMFHGASSFNQPLNNWDVSNVALMGGNNSSDGGMFEDAISFNQPIDNWDVSNVTDMMKMFHGASSFNQDISSWNFNSEVKLSLTAVPESAFFLSGSGLSVMNYDLLLQRFANLELENKLLGAGGLQYCNSSVRDYLINILGWTFYGDSLADDCDYNTIYGKVLLDENNDGCDSEDTGISAFFINADNETPYYSTLPNEGNYQLNLFDDTYTVSLQNVPEYYTVTPESYTVSYTGFGNYEELNFCLTATQTIQDLNITLLPVTEARPGFETEYQLVVQNFGTHTVNNVVVNLIFDNTKQTFLAATPAPVSTTSNELIFEITSLSPFSSSTIDLTMETFTPPTVNGDDILNFTATVTPNDNDYTPNDNTFSLEQIAVNSYDPNDKQVLQGDKIHIDNVGEYLHYLIRFQNTGTASAIHVRIEDELHETLDWNTIQIIGASHNYRVEITEGNQIQFIFENINLPYEDTDEAGSNGFIAYKIKAIEGLQIGDFIIGNEAEIYFDFNLPIITNATSTEVVLPLPEVEPNGVVTLDENNNGCDTDDTKSDFFFVQIDNGMDNYSFSPKEGVYTLDFLENDIYTVSLSIPEYFTVTPESYTLDYQGLGDYEALDFCVTANQEVEDLHLVILPLNQAQVGSTNHYRIVAQNLGTQPLENLSLILEFEPTQQTFVTSSPEASSVSSNQLNFIINSLPILQNTTIDFSMQTFSTPTVNVGDVLLFNAWGNSDNDNTPNDNTFELKQVVEASSQPNYKQVLQGEKILIEQASEYLHYLISFENTNITTVTDIRIEEYLHETLNWNTFQVINGSHTYQVGITQSNQIEFTFENINLAPSETGFISYRIKLVEGIQVGDMIIGNEAEIYFDGTLSSVTNATSTEIVNPTVGITPNVKDMLWVYPNPTRDVLNIQTKGNIQLEEVQLYNLQGRILISSQQNLQAINLGDLSSGVYLLSIKTSEGNFSQRVIKK